MRGIGVLVVAVALVACSSSTEGTGDGQGGGGKTETGCADITGNYTVTPSWLSGTCPKPDDFHDVSITVGEDKTGFYVLLPNVDNGCPATLNPDTCRFQAQCKLFDKADPNVTLVTYNLDWTVSGTSVTGSLVAGGSAGVLAADACSVTLKHDGKRL